MPPGFLAGTHQEFLYIVFGAPERRKSRDGFDSSVSVSMEYALSGNERMSARPFRLSVHIVQRNERRYQQEAGEWGLGNGDSGLGTRRQGYVRRSGFREAYRRMSFLTIETEL